MFQNTGRHPLYKNPPVSCKDIAPIACGSCDRQRDPLRVAFRTSYGPGDTDNTEKKRPTATDNRTPSPHPRTSTEHPLRLSRDGFLPHDCRQQSVSSARLDTATSTRTLSLDRHDPLQRREHTQTGDPAKNSCGKNLYCHDRRDT